MRKSLLSGQVMARYRSQNIRASEVMAREGVDALIVFGQNQNWMHRQLIVDLAAKSQLPAIHFFTESVEGGGLIAYGLDWSDVGRHSGHAAAQILQGKS